MQYIKQTDIGPTDVGELALVLNDIFPTKKVTRVIFKILSRSWNLEAFLSEARLLRNMGTALDVVGCNFCAFNMRKTSIYKISALREEAKQEKTHIVVC